MQHAKVPAVSDGSVQMKWLCLDSDNNISFHSQPQRTALVFFWCKLYWERHDQNVSFSLLTWLMNTSEAWQKESHREEMRAALLSEITTNISRWYSPNVRLHNWSEASKHHQTSKFYWSCESQGKRGGGGRRGLLLKCAINQEQTGGVGGGGYQRFTSEE